VNKWKIILIVSFLIFAIILIANLFVEKKINLLESPTIIKKIIVPAKKPEIKSEIKDFQIQEKNSTNLANYLDELNFFGENAITLRKTNQKVTVKNLNIILTDQKYLFNNFSERGKIGHLRSTDEKFENGNLTLFVGMNSKYYASHQDQILAAFQSQVLLATFALASPTEYSKINNFSRDTMPKIIIKYFDILSKEPAYQININQ
jgi:hypothetical protein